MSGDLDSMWEPCDFCGDPGFRTGETGVVDQSGSNEGKVRGAWIQTDLRVEPQNLLRTK